MILKGTCHINLECAYLDHHVGSSNRCHPSSLSVCGCCAAAHKLLLRLETEAKGTAFNTTKQPVTK